MADVVLGISALVTSDGKLKFMSNAHQSYSFKDVKKAMIMVRDEIDRQLKEGPTTCPFAKHRGTREWWEACPAISRERFS